VSDLPEKIGPVPVDKPWHQFRDFMAKKAGPLPIWAWTLLGGGVIAAVVLMHGNIPGMGALSGQGAQNPQGGGGGDTGGSGSGANPQGVPPASQAPGGGSTPQAAPSAPTQPPLSGGGAGDVPLLGVQSGGAGGYVAPTAPAPYMNYREPQPVYEGGPRRGGPVYLADAPTGKVPTATSAINNVQHSAVPMPNLGGGIGSVITGAAEHAAVSAQALKTPTAPAPPAPPPPAPPAYREPTSSSSGRAGPKFLE
jgi:hypothetical protein